MKISYALTVCNEVQEFKRLLDFLTTCIREEDEIVVLIDGNKGLDKELREIAMQSERVSNVVVSGFEGDFAKWKNLLNSYCTGEYIFQLDADELPAEKLIEFLPQFLELNPGTELFFVPRQNRVEGLTREDIQRWGWNVNEQGLVNWPDYQGRIYKNLPSIQWSGKVHERITGMRVYGRLPDQLYLEHNKTIVKQREQNTLYNKLQYE